MYKLWGMISIIQSFSLFYYFCAGPLTSATCFITFILFTCLSIFFSLFFFVPSFVSIMNVHAVSWSFVYFFHSHYVNSLSHYLKWSIFSTQEFLNHDPSILSRLISWINSLQEPDTPAIIQKRYVFWLFSFFILNFKGWYNIREWTSRPSLGIVHLSLSTSFNIFFRPYWLITGLIHFHKKTHADWPWAAKCCETQDEPADFPQIHIQVLPVPLHIVLTYGRVSQGFALRMYKGCRLTSVQYTLGLSAHPHFLWEFWSYSGWTSPKFYYTY